jgi:hypothetical protein
LRLACLRCVGCLRERRRWPSRSRRIASVSTPSTWRSRGAPRTITGSGVGGPRRSPCPIATCGLPNWTSWLASAACACASGGATGGVHPSPARAPARVGVGEAADRVRMTRHAWPDAAPSAGGGGSSGRQSDHDGRSQDERSQNAPVPQRTQCDALYGHESPFAGLGAGAVGTMLTLRGRKGRFMSRKQCLERRRLLLKADDGGGGPCAWC